MSLAELTKTCQCGQTFHAEHADHEFCSSDCREKLAYDKRKEDERRLNSDYFVDDPIRCPKCDSRSKLVWSRMTSEGRVRRRVCRNKDCKKRWSTLERMRQ